MDQNQKMFVWGAIVIDLFFIVLGGFNISHDINHGKWGWLVFSSLIEAFWVWCFITDIAALRR